MAINTCTFSTQLQVNVSGGLQRIAHNEKSHDTFLRKRKQRLRMLNFRAHDALNRPDFRLQSLQFILRPQGSVCLIPSVVCVPSRLNGCTRHAFERTHAHTDEQEASGRE